MTPTNVIHDTDECTCKMCQWADKQERFEPSDDEAIADDIDKAILELRTKQRLFSQLAIRAAIFDVLDGGDGITPATVRSVGFRNDWFFDPEDESEAETERRMRFVDAVIARLEKG